MLEMPIVLLISGKAEHGKDSFADSFIKEAQDRLGYRCLRIKYGDFVKMVATTYYNWNGEKDEKGRHLLQKIGTDLGRANNPDVWVNCVKEIVKALQTECDFVLVSDCRFPNELDWSNTPFFTFTIRISRQNEDGTPYINHLTEEQKQHPSETALDEYKFNYEVQAANLDNVDAAAQAILEDILKLDKENN